MKSGKSKEKKAKEKTSKKKRPRPRPRPSGRNTSACELDTRRDFKLGLRALQVNKG